MHKFMPKVHAHIASMDIVPALYASKWFITIFCYEFPFDAVFRIWDIYLHEGIKFIFRVSLALIKMNEDKIMKIDKFELMMKFLQNIHNEDNFDIDALLKQAFDFGLKHDHLHIVEQKYNQQKLRESRNRARSGRQRRDVSELEQPAFIKKFSVSQQNDAVKQLPLQQHDVQCSDSIKDSVSVDKDSLDKDTGSEEKKTEEDEEEDAGSHSD